MVAMITQFEHLKTQYTPFFFFTVVACATTYSSITCHGGAVLSVCLQVFAYDYCFWSMDETDKEKFAGM